MVNFEDYITRWYRKWRCVLVKRETKSSCRYFTYLV